MALDGSLSPGETLGMTLFRMQSRVASERDKLGPVVTGEAIPATGESWAKLENFTFGPGIKTMLPDMVRRFMEEHQLAGDMNASVHIKPRPGGGTPEFRVEINLYRGNLAVSPDQWLSRVERRQIDTLHGAFDLMRVGGLNSARETAAPKSSTAPVDPANQGLIDHLEGTITPSLVRLTKVDGRFIFTQDGIQVDKLTGWVEKNSFQIDGHIDGYAADAPAELDVVGTDIFIPHTPEYANAMPRVVREIYEALHPEGSGRLWVKMVRQGAGTKPIVSGELVVLDGQINLNEFPYPLRNLTGKISFGPDPVHGTRLDIVDIRAHGIKGGPNENNTVTINGLLSPIDGDAEMNINVVGEHIFNEPAIRAALPREGRDALHSLDPSGKGDFPTFKSNILANIHREPGPYKPFKITLTMDLEDGAGAFEGFPYPLEHMTGRVVIGDGYVRLEHCSAKKADASVTLDGGLTFGRGIPLTPDISLTARNVPIDQTLMTAISPERREWIEKLGVSGKLDVDGNIFLRQVPTTGPVVHAVTKPATQPTEVMVDLKMGVHDGALWPKDSTFAVSDLSGKLHLFDGRIDFDSFKGRRGGAAISASGSALWANHRPDLSISASAKNLLLEPALYQLLPADAQAAWNSVHPEGTLDVGLEYGKSLGATTQPATQPTYHVSLIPGKLAATLKDVPYRLTDLSGKIDVGPNGTTLTNVMGKHNAATIVVSGTGGGTAEGAAGGWKLTLQGRDVPVDDDLRKALPTASAALIKSMNLTGKLGFDFKRLDYRPAPLQKNGKSTDGDFDLGGTLWFNGASMEVGLPISEANGAMQFEAGIRRGKLGAVKAKIESGTLKLAGRNAKDFSVDLYKPELYDAMRLDKIQGSLAGGEIAGQVDLAFPENAASRFALTLVLRNADVTQLTGEKDIHGQLTASGALEGSWNDPSSRRGRGDVTVAGRDMYHIPLMLGLMQLTNLSLPISSPFSEGNARYSVDGQRITFERIELRASNMLMQGSGSMNFDTKKVKMTFETDNPNWPKLPIVNELLQGAKHELLQIHVNGTIEEPKVSGSVMNTFQTTIDEVLRGGRPEDSAKRSKK
jgi:hypothetical protein